MDIVAWFVAGATTWAISVGVKVVASGVLHAATDSRLPDGGLGALEGVVSAVCELGAAALVLALVLSEGTPLTVVAFGLGAGSLEGALLYIAARESGSADQGDRPPTPDPEPLTGPRRHTFVVERGAALLGHVGSRGLVWLSVHGPLWPAGLALLAFAAVDGVAAYGLRRNWDWMAPRIWWRFYTFALGTGLLEVLAFLVLLTRIR